MLIWTVRGQACTPGGLDRKIALCGLDGASEDRYSSVSCRDGTQDNFCALEQWMKWGRESPCFNLPSGPYAVVLAMHPPQVAPSQLDVVWPCRESLHEAGIFPITRFTPELAENQQEPANILPLAA